MGNFELKDVEDNCMHDKSRCLTSSNWWKGGKWWQWVAPELPTKCQHALQKTNNFFKYSTWVFMNSVYSVPFLTILINANVLIDGQVFVFLFFLNIKWLMQVEHTSAQNIYQQYLTSNMKSQNMWNLLVQYFLFSWNTSFFLFSMFKVCH